MGLEKIFVVLITVYAFRSLTIVLFWYHLKCLSEIWLKTFPQSPHTAIFCQKCSQLNTELQM